jgi:putative ABC transport system permease protein
MDFKAYVRTHLPSLSIAREPEIVDELAQHLGDLYEEGRAAGFSHDDALARAVKSMADHPEVLGREIESASRALPPVIARTWDRVVDVEAAGGERGDRTTRELAPIADLRRDVTYALRMLARAPGFLLVTVLTLSLGIGANSAIFSAVNAIVLRSAPVADPERVVTAYLSSPDGHNPFASTSYSYSNYVDLRDSGAFEGLAAYASIAVAVEMNGVLEQVPGEIVSGNYFDVIGVRPPMGRAFRSDEDQPGSPVRVVVVTHGFWKERLGGDPNVVGRSIGINGAAYTIIGVAPPGFTSHMLGRVAELFVPMPLQQEVRPPSAGLRRQLGHANLLITRAGGWLNTVGRLRPDATTASTTAALNLVAERPEWRIPGAAGPRKFGLARLGEGPGLRAATGPLLGILGGAVMLVLLIACANVAGLLAARAVSRRREVAIRLAVGASRGRLIRQWLTESVLLALMGSAGALLVARWMTSLLHTFGVPETVDLSLDGRVLTFTLLVGVISGLMFGLAPVLQALRRDTLTALREEGGSIASGARSTRMRRGFVVFQVALSLMLLVGGGLFLRTIRNAYAVDPGYVVDGVLLADINLDLRGYSEATGQELYQRLIDRLTALPGVRGVGASRVTVLSGGARTGAVSIDGQPVRPDGSNSVTSRINIVTDAYTGTMGIPILQGRGFQASDTAASPRVALVSQSLARRVWPGRDPIGQIVNPGPGASTVVGVIPDAVYTSVIERDPHPFFLLPLSQNYESGVTLHVRGTGDPLALVPSVRQAVREIDSQLVLARPRTLADELARSLGAQRLMATFVGFFAGLALLLAAIGLYGVMSHAAGERKAEIGIRLALGAKPAAILSMVIGDGLKLVGVGLVLGLAGAFGLSRIVERQLFGVTARDPVTYAIVALVLTAATIAACVIPARRAMRVDPVGVLRR